MQPTTDPATSQALRDAIDNIAAQAQQRRWPPGVGYDPVQVMADQTYVPQPVATRLLALTHLLGYTVHFAPLGEDPACGFVLGKTTGYPEFQVQLHDECTHATTVRTWMHELGHAILCHVPRNALEHARMQAQNPQNLGPYTEVSTEEVAVELAAAAIAQQVRLTDGQFSVDYLASKLRGRRITAQETDAANLAARVLWAGIFEGEATHA